MVGPSRWERDESARQNLKYGFVVMVGLSAGLIGLQGGASTVQTGVLVLAGVLVGVGLLWYLSWTVGRDT